MQLKTVLRPAAAMILVVGGGATAAHAQTWTGFYVGGQVGSGFLPGGDGTFVRFDTNLEGRRGPHVHEREPRSPRRTQGIRSLRPLRPLR